MKLFFVLFVCLALGLSPQSAEAFPVVANGGFEAPFTATGFTGSGDVQDWILEPALNPPTVQSLAGVTSLGGQANMYDNGLNGEGSQLLFLYQGFRQVPSVSEPTRVSQTIPGFKKGKKYYLHYSENARMQTSVAGVDTVPIGGFISGMNLTVYLNGQIIDAEHRVAPLENVNSHTQPFLKRRSLVFDPPADGAYKLTFAASMTENRDATLLLDDVYFEQTPADPNTAPLIEVIADQTAQPGLPLEVMVIGIDTNEPPQKLTFSFVGTVPEGMQMVPQEGNQAKVQWTPQMSHAGKSFHVTLKATDNGAGELSATRSFGVQVTLGTELNIRFEEGRPFLGWSAYPNTRYQLVYKNSLDDPDWIQLTEPFFSGSENAPASQVDPIEPYEGTRFYMLLIN